jgi:hypothetical protein
MLKLKRGKKSGEKLREYKKGRKREQKKATVNDPNNPGSACCLVC